MLDPFSPAGGFDCDAAGPEHGSRKAQTGKARAPWQERFASQGIVYAGQEGEEGYQAQGESVAQSKGESQSKSKGKGKGYGDPDRKQHRPWKWSRTRRQGGWEQPKCKVGGSSTHRKRTRPWTRQWTPPPNPNAEGAPEHQLGCPRCRWAGRGCLTCRDPTYVPRARRNAGGAEA